MKESWPLTDHDTLIEIRTLVGELKRDISDLKEGTQVQLVDHEKRLRGVEDLAIRMRVYMGIAIGLGGILGAIISQVLKIWLETSIGK